MTEMSSEKTPKLWLILKMGSFRADLLTIYTKPYFLELWNIEAQLRSPTHFHFSLLNYMSKRYFKNIKQRRTIKVSVK